MISPHLLRRLALPSAALLLVASCAPVTPAENRGVFSNGNAQSGAAGMNRAGTAATGGQLAGSGPGAALATQVTTVIAKHQASVRQRQVAAARARAAYAKIVRERTNYEQVMQKKMAKSKDPKQKTAKIASPSSSVASMYRKPRIPRIPRYLAVETEKDENTASGAKKAVMIWDTESQEIVGNNVYDIATAPGVGTDSRFETFSAEYVGAGL